MTRGRGESGWWELDEGDTGLGVRPLLVLPAVVWVVCEASECNRLRLAGVSFLKFNRLLG